MSRPEDSIVNIHIGGELQATGVMVAGEKVVTCLHVIHELFESKNYVDFTEQENPNNLVIEVEHGRTKRRAEILRGNQHHDLCLLDVKGLKSPTLEVVQKPESQAGDKVFSFSKPAGKLLVGNGTILALNEVKSGEPPLIINDAPGIYGSSGGALLNHKDELIGIQSLRGAALPVAWVIELLERQDNKIISRDAEPASEVDYYFNAISAAIAMPPRRAPFAKWVLERPESQLAAKSFMAYHGANDLGSQENISLKDREKIIATLAGHVPILGTKPSHSYENIADLDFSNNVLREKFLLKAINLTHDKVRQAGIYRSLGDMYLEARQPAKAEKAFLEITKLLRDKQSDQLLTLRAAYAHLSSLYLDSNDKPRAHLALAQAFEMDCKGFGADVLSNAPEAYEIDFKNVVKFIEQLSGNKRKLFEGSFEEQEVFRKCMQQVSALSSDGKSTSLGG